MAALVRSYYTQYFPPAHTLNATDIGSQRGKVFIVTGSNQGIGYELVNMLYPTGATIYLACRSEERALAAIASITAAYSLSPPATPAVLAFLYLDLNDLTTIKASVNAFKSQQSRLDILWNNAGIGSHPEGSTTKQSLEAHIGVNCVGPYLFTTLLLPVLQATAVLEQTPPSSVRVVWTGSLMIDSHSPPGGVDFTFINKATATVDPMREYGQSKAGNLLLAVEAAKRWGQPSDTTTTASNHASRGGIVSVCQNPGNLKTHIYDSQNKYAVAMLSPILRPQIYGAYTMLFAGFTSEVEAGSTEKNGLYIIPWGRVRQNSRKDIYEAIDKGKAAEFWEFCDSKSKAYA